MDGGSEETERTTATPAIRTLRQEHVAWGGCVRVGGLLSPMWEAFALSSKRKSLQKHISPVIPLACFGSPDGHFLVWQVSCYQTPPPTTWAGASRCKEPDPERTSTFTLVAERAEARLPTSSPHRLSWRPPPPPHPTRPHTQIQDSYASLNRCARSFPSSHSTLMTPCTLRTPRAP